MYVVEQDREYKNMSTESIEPESGDEFKNRTFCVWFYEGSGLWGMLLGRLSWKLSPGFTARRHWILVLALTNWPDLEGMQRRLPQGHTRNGQAHYGCKPSGPGAGSQDLPGELHVLHSPPWLQEVW